LPELLATGLVEFPSWVGSSAEHIEFDEHRLPRFN
jgi:hypothetical protein